MQIGEELYEHQIRDGKLVGAPVLLRRNKCKFIKTPTTAEYADCPKLEHREQIKSDKVTYNESSKYDYNRYVSNAKERYLKEVDEMTDTDSSIAFNKNFKNKMTKDTKNKERSNSTSEADLINDELLVSIIKNFKQQLDKEEVKLEEKMFKAFLDGHCAMISFYKNLPDHQFLFRLREIN